MKLKKQNKTKTTQLLWKINGCPHVLSLYSLLEQINSIKSFTCMIRKVQKKEDTNTRVGHVDQIFSCISRDLSRK